WMNAYVAMRVSGFDGLKYGDSRTVAFQQHFTPSACLARRIGMGFALRVEDPPVRLVARSHRDLSVAIRDIQDVGRLAEAGGALSQAPHQRLALRERGPEVRRAGRQVSVVQVVRLDPQLHEPPHQR